MAHIDNPDSQLTAVKWRFPSVHPEGRKFAVISGAIAFFLLVLDGSFTELMGWLRSWLAATGFAETAL